MEYNNDDPKGRSLPNPLKVENLFLFLTSAGLLVIAVGLVLVVRAHPEEDPGRVFRGMGAAFLILVAAITFTAVALTQFKFYFGASEPSSLPAKVLQEALEQGDLHPPEPTGPLNGLLYSWVEHLIDAPIEIQRLAQLQFRNGATMVALLVSLTLTETIGRVGVADATWPTLSSWVGTVFLMLATYLLTVASPWRRLDKKHIVTSKGSLAFLILLPLLGPLLATVLSNVGPQSWVSVFPGVFMVLIAAVAIYWMFFYALMGDLPSRPSREVSSLQQTWSIRCPPVQIMNQLDRILRERTTQPVGTRRYAWTEPKIDLNAPAGDFFGQAVVEGEPRPMTKESPQFLEAWAHPERQRIVLLDIAGAALTLIGATLIAIRAAQPTQVELLWSGSFLVYGPVFAALGSFAFAAGHRIWSRFDFESRALMMTLSGHYISNSLEVGSKGATIKTNSKLVQSESMTFRLWAARLHTVTYGRGGQRFLVHMTGDSQFVTDLSQHLYEFTEQQASIVSPSAPADLTRQAQRDAMNPQLSKDTLTPPPPALLGANTELAATPGSAPDTAQAARYCGACGVAVNRGDKFCWSCGKAQAMTG